MTKKRPEAEALLERIQSIVGLPSIPRFAEAITHPSYANEAKARDNQRLEFLGDAVLGLAVSEILSERYPDADEGMLTRMRAGVVNAEALARWARTTGVGPALTMGRGADLGPERDQNNVLADAVEAILAAVYHEGGLAAARALALDVIREPLEEAARLMGRDPKSALQEEVQARGERAPSYRIVASTVPPEEPRFDVEVLSGDEVLGRGSGRSKRLAERAAAEAALSKRPIRRV